MCVLLIVGLEFLFFKQGPHLVGLEHVALLPQCPQGWDYRRELLHLLLLIEKKAMR